MTDTLIQNSAGAIDIRCEILLCLQFPSRGRQMDNCFNPFQSNLVICLAEQFGAICKAGFQVGNVAADTNNLRKLVRVNLLDKPPADKSACSRDQYRTFSAHYLS